MSFFYWTFEVRPPKKPETLADVPDGIACIVIRQDCVFLVRQRIKDRVANITMNAALSSVCDNSPSEYAFVRYLDDPGQPPLPETLRDAEPYRLYRLVNFDCMFWRDECGQLRALINGYVHSEGPSVEDRKITAATNIYAKLVTIGPAQ